jgi:hypothetical protein
MQASQSVKSGTLYSYVDKTKSSTLVQLSNCFDLIERALSLCGLCWVMRDAQSGIGIADFLVDAFSIAY